MDEIDRSKRPNSSRRHLVKPNGQANRILNAIDAGGRDDVPPAEILLVAHFPQMLRVLQDFAPKLPTKTRLHICLAKSIDGELHSVTAPPAGKASRSSLRSGIPTRSTTTGCCAPLDGLPYPCVLRHHLSLEDALLRMFGGDSVIATLRRLGMREEEAVNSKMVSRRLRGAQNRIAKAATSDLPADSAEQWLRLNAPLAGAAR